MRGPVERAAIRAVLFDLGGTLLDLRDPNAWAEIAQGLGLAVDADHLVHALAQAELTTERPDGHPTQLEFWDLVLRLASDGQSAPGLSRRFLDELEKRDPPVHLFSDVRRCLDELRRQDRKLGIVSNSKSEARVRELLGRAGIADYFPVVVSSGTEGVAKPDPEIFRRAVDRVGVSAVQSFYVGDLPQTDAVAARRAGLESVWLNRAGTGLGDDPPEITSLTELPRWIRRVEDRVD